MDLGVKDTAIEGSNRIDQVGLGHNSVAREQSLGKSGPRVGEILPVCAPSSGYGVGNAQHVKHPGLSEAGDLSRANRVTGNSIRYPNAHVSQALGEAIRPFRRVKFDAPMANRISTRVRVG